MTLIVQKFGGTSVGSVEKIQAAAARAMAAQAAGAKVVVVVSAMGKETDRLVALAQAISPNPPPREMDMLLSTGEQVSVALFAMAIQEAGGRAISQTGFQVGIRTDRAHTKARIHAIPAERLHALLDGGAIVVAAGFQGVDDEGNITTLGRGGSDTTAVALAAALDADRCEIYTDVEGVFTTDPRVVPEARPLARISYDEMLELASLGAGVMHNRSIEFAKKHAVPIVVRHSQRDTPGTLITEAPDAAAEVSGAALMRCEAQIVIRGVPNRPGVIASIFSAIADRNIPVDMILQDVAANDVADISFTVAEADLAEAAAAAQMVASQLGAERVETSEEVAKVSIVGAGMACNTGVASRMFRALADAGVSMEMITTSEIKVSALIAREQGQQALQAVHRAFALEQTPPPREPEPPAAEPGQRKLEEIVAQLRRMEDLVIQGVQLDESQGHVAVHGAPDAPGVAAELFEQLAQADVFVDMIVQSTGRDSRASLSFTVPTESVSAAAAIAEQVAADWPGARVAAAPRIVKLSVSGIGMRSHADVAVRAFTALAEAGFNIEMVSTSEVRVNLVASGGPGPAAQACLEAAFADAML